MFQFLKFCKKLLYTHLGGEILLILAAFIFSASGLIYRLSGSSREIVTFIRFFIPLCLALFFHNNVKADILKNLKSKIGFVLALLSVARIYLFVWGYTTTPLAPAIAIFFAYPIFVPYFSRLVLKTKITFKQMMLTLICFLGVILIYFDAFLNIRAESEKSIGLLAMLASSVIFALMIPIYKQQMPHKSDLQTLIFQNLYPSLLTFPLLFIVPFSTFQFTVVSGYMVFGGFLAAILFNHALKTLPSVKFNVLVYFEVIFVALWGILFFHETLSVQFLFGTSCILLSTYLIKK